MRVHHPLKIKSQHTDKERQNRVIIFNKHNIIENWVLEYDASLIFRVAVVGQKFESLSNEVEQWYGTKYRLEKIPDSVLNVSFLVVILCGISFYRPVSLFFISVIMLCIGKCKF
jgi:hypothetical protein